VQIIELYTGPDEKTHVREHTVAGLADIVSAATGPVMVTIPNSPQERAGGRYFVDWHPAPSRVLYVICTGSSDYETEEGWRRLFPGDIVIFNDPAGKGHRVRVTEPSGRITFGAIWAPEKTKELS
jgi:hypothetical protein